ncbi:mCG146016, partial [Mus musculus]
GDSRWHLLWFEQRLRQLGLSADYSEHGKFCFLKAVLPPKGLYHPSFSTPEAAENPNAMLPGTSWYQNTKTPALPPMLGVRKFFSLIWPIRCTLNIARPPAL